MKQLLILLILASLTFACKKKNEDPTIFEGKVVYADDGSPVSGAELRFSPSLKSPLLTGAKTGELKKTTTNEKGEFRVEFPYSDEYIYFISSLAFRGSDGVVTSSFNTDNGMDCAPYDCEDFKPHQNYSSLIIKIPRP
jgi:hypothetical protein